MAKIESTAIASNGVVIPGTLPTEGRFEDLGDSGVATSRSHRIKSLQDLLSYFDVDTEVWMVERVITNSWEIGAKVDGRIIVEPLFQLKAYLKRNVEAVKSRKVIDDMIADAASHAPVYPPAKRPARKKTGYMLEISPCDLHLGKWCDAEETGTAYDVSIAKAAFTCAMQELVERSSGFKFDSILFVIGNDMLNTDGHEKMTTNGTPQDECGRWQKTFTAARKLLVKTIDSLREIAPVKVVVVSGNHDMERALYLGEVIDAWYRNCKDVEVDNTRSLRKYHRHGQVLLGFTHGDREPLRSLPLIMADERAKDWGETQFREIHTGHMHKKKEMEFVSVDEFRTVRVRQLPSLSATCAWAAGKGYSALRAAEAYVWHDVDGYVGHFSASPKK